VIVNIDDAGRATGNAYHTHADCTYLKATTTEIDDLSTLTLLGMHKCDRCERQDRQASDLVLTTLTTSLRDHGLLPKGTRFQDALNMADQVRKDLLAAGIHDLSDSGHSSS
jgi:hypothetical protein